MKIEYAPRFITVIDRIQVTRNLGAGVVTIFRGQHMPVLFLFSSTASGEPVAVTHFSLS